MYRTCLFCHADLGDNPVIERFPVGRRLAFDPARGRLWVVCRACYRWNLTPIEERWEAIEDCERRFRAAPRRASTGEISLAQIPPGLDLVRIGEPLRPEFAGWRYGQRFTQRRRLARRRALLIGTAAAGGGAAGMVAGTFILGAMGLAGVGAQVGYQLVEGWAKRRHQQAQHARILGRLHTPEGKPVILMGSDAPESKIVEHTGAGRWALRLLRDEPVDLLGEDAMRGLGLLAAVANEAGGTTAEVSAAVQWIEDGGGPGGFLRLMARRGQGFKAFAFEDVHPSVRLALEMAAHEDFERAAMEVDLKLLYHAWREAEAIAGIADDLLLPEGVEEFLARHRPRAAPGDLTKIP